MESKNSFLAPEKIKDSVDEVAKYDPEFRFRQLSDFTLKLAFAMTLILSIFHIYTAGFGVLQEWRHRAFHLAFVLPLVFLFYSIRKEKTEGKKYFVYDLIYSSIGSSLLATMFREIFSLSLSPTILLVIISFLLILYFKRREFLGGRIIVYPDFLLFTLLIGGFIYAMFVGFTHFDFAGCFEDINAPLVFWSIFLFGTFLSIFSLFVIQWTRSLATIIRGKPFKYNQDNIPYFDVFFALLSSVISVYIFLEFNSLVLRAGLPEISDLVMGSFAILLVLEGARRSIGAPLPLISFLVLINCYLGPYFLHIPGLSFFAHRGYSIPRIIEHMYLGTEGIFGIPLGVVATFVFHFVLFGIFISKTGLGQLFIDLAMAVAGGTVGGPAKVSVVSSGFLGSISGSSIANTVTTGAFTIPLMKKVGYAPKFAGAVEAASSTGGQLMPPIMGAAAFIMAEFLGIPYIKIAACAIVPAFLHFFAVGTMVHFEALKQGLAGLPRDMLPRIGDVLRERGLLVMPLFVIVYLLITGSSPFLAAFWGIIYSVAIGQIHRRTFPLLVTIIVSIPSVLLRANPLEHISVLSILWIIACAGGFSYTFKKTDKISWLIGILTTLILTVLLIYRMDPSLCAFWGNMTVIAIGVFYKDSKMRVPDILNTLEWGTKNALAIGAACACVGFIVGATTLTGLGLKFAAAVIQLAHRVAFFISNVDFLSLLTIDSLALFFTLVFTAIACFVLGMGLPTTAQYIIASMIAAPALMQWGIHPLVSHMFVLFYAVLADVTPPVALAAYAASGISGGDPFRTGFTAFGLASAGFYVPFAFVYFPIILWLPRLLDTNTGFNYLEFIMIFVTIILGVIALGSTIIGYLKTKSTLPERIMTGIATFCLFLLKPYFSLVGFGILVSVYLIQRRKKSNTESR